MARKRKRTPTAPRPVPLLFETVHPDHRMMMTLVANGTSFEALEEGYECDPRLPSRSSSSLQRDYRSESQALLDQLNGRSLRDLDLAAIVMDGTPMGDRMLVWAIGITLDGVKIPLGVTEGPSESGEIVAEMVEGFVERDLDVDNVVWIIDGSDALAAGIRRATHGRAEIQRCRVHLQRAVMGRLTKTQRAAIHKELRAQLRIAWAKSTYERGLAALQDTASWLEQQGHDGAAKTLRDGMELTLTLQRLGLNHRELRHSIDSTNVIESPHTGVSKWKRRVGRWRAEEGGMRKRALATVVARAERAWQLVANRRALEQVPLAVLTGRHLGGGWAELTDDGQLVVTRLPTTPDELQQAYPAIRDLLRWADRLGKTVTLEPDVLAAVAHDERLASWLAASGFADGARAPRPPGEIEWMRVASVDFGVEKLPVPAKDADAARELVTGALGLERDASAEIACAGSAEALGALGLHPDRHTTVEELTAAAQGRHATEGRQVRPATPRQLVDADGAPTGQTAQGVVTVTWQLAPPAEVTERWLDGDADQRAQIEQALTESAAAAIGRVVDTEQAAVAFVVDRGDAEAPALAVRGVVLGAMRDGRLVSPIDESVLPRRTELERAQADAGDLAAGLLDAELVRLGPEAGVGRPPPGVEWSTEDYLAALGPQRGGWLADQAEQAHADAALDDWSLRVLQTEQEKVGDPFAQLDRDGALRALTLEQRRATAEARAAVEADGEAAQQAIARTDRELRELHTSGAHPNRWMQRFRWVAVKALALKRELGEREGAIARDGGVTNLSEHYRSRLGGERVGELSERAHEHLAACSEMPAEELGRRRGMLATQLHPAREQLDAAARKTHGRDERLDAWMEQWAEPAAELVGVQAAINERTRAAELAAPELDAAPEVGVEA